MKQELEEELERVMRAAGEDAPRPELNLVEQIDARGRHRRRRNQVRTIVACGTAIAAVGAVGLAVDAIRPNSIQPADGTTVQTKPEPKRESSKKEATSVPLAKDVWPQAVHRIPQKLPDGREIFPLTFLDANTLLISTQSSFEKTDALARYDVKTHATQLIANVDSPGYANDFRVQDGWIVWWANDEKSKTPGTEIWGVPLAGGEARRLVVAPGAGIDFLSVSGGEVHWSYEQNEKQVYSAPLTGDGQARAIPRSKGYHIVSWPWIGSPGDPMKNGSIPDQQILYRTLRNVETGETRTTTDLRGRWSCGLTWCMGMSKDKSYAQRRDGSGRQSFDGVSFDTVTAMTPMPVRDRFDVDALTIVDLHTGKVASLDHDGGNGFRMAADDRLHYSFVKNGYELIDLAAIK